MTVEEAVRIVREQIIPSNPRARNDALETVLAALEQAQSAERCAGYLSDLATYWHSAADEAQALLDDLKTEQGKAAFAIANGWPLPEEMAGLRAEVERLREALAVGVEAVVNLCTHLYLTPVEAHWHDGPRQDLNRMRAALAPAQPEAQP